MHDAPFPITANGKGETGDWSFRHISAVKYGPSATLTGRVIEGPHRVVTLSRPLDANESHNVDAGRWVSLYFLAVQVLGSLVDRHRAPIDG